MLINQCDIDGVTSTQCQMDPPVDLARGQNNISHLRGT